MADQSEKSGEAEAAASSDRPPCGAGGARPGPVAVALSDKAFGNSPPRIVAKGHGKVAEQILEIAFARGVKVRTDANLAEVLAAIDVESEVPLQALAAVAEILTYVYRANGTEVPEADPSEPPSTPGGPHPDDGGSP